MDNFDIKEKFEIKRKRIDALIETYLPVEEGYASPVIEAMNYSIRVGGKRLRPMLMEEFYKLARTGVSGALADEDVLHYFMAAIECIHTYSLVHDDLPAMDDDLLRRGQPTTHAKYGEDVAILAGDALLNYAMELTVRGLALSDEKNFSGIAQCQHILFDRSGIYGMIGGQTADVCAESFADADQKDLLDFIHHKKTGALIVAACLSGAILGGADSDMGGIVIDIADRIGLAFQIRDDILDVTGDEATLGKPIGSDEKNDKLTYVLQYGIEAAEKKVQTLTKEAHELLDKLPGDAAYLHALFDLLTQRES